MASMPAINKITPVVVGPLPRVFSSMYPFPPDALENPPCPVMPGSVSPPSAAARVGSGCVAACVDSPVSATELVGAGVAAVPPAVSVAASVEVTSCVPATVAVIACVAGRVAVGLADGTSVAVAVGASVTVGVGVAVGVARCGSGRCRLGWE